MSISELNLDQLRRRAKELLAAVRAGDPTARSRLVRPHDPARLSDAQFTVARELGFADWSAATRALADFSIVDAPEVPWERITEVTVICFPTRGQVSLHRDGSRWVAPHDAVEPGEDVWDDAVLRIPLLRMGFRRQGTHAIAVDPARRHVVMWVDGGPYTGLRPHATEVETWTGTVAEAVQILTEQGDLALARLVTAAAHDQATMPYRKHQRDLQRTLTAGYLRGATLPAGSGFGGSEQDWTDARECLTAVLEGLPEALARPGEPVSFLDLGCANGHLAASFVPWGAARGVTVEPYGVDLSPELVARARELHPQWADRFWDGDALTWQHPEGRQFDAVHLLLDVFPPDLHRAAIENALSLVSPGGRLLISHYEVRPELSAETLVTALGYEVAGRTPRRTRRRNGKPYGEPSVWLQR